MEEGILVLLAVVVGIYAVLWAEERRAAAPRGHADGGTEP